MENISTILSHKIIILLQIHLFLVNLFLNHGNNRINKVKTSVSLLLLLLLTFLPRRLYRQLLYRHRHRRLPRRHYTLFPNQTLTTSYLILYLLSLIFFSCIDQLRFCCLFYCSIFIILCRLFNKSNNYKFRLELKQSYKSYSTITARRKHKKRAISKTTR